MDGNLVWSKIATIVLICITCIGIPAGELAVPCTCNPLQQGWFPILRDDFVWSAPYRPRDDGWVSCNRWL